MVKLSIVITSPMAAMLGYWILEGILGMVGAIDGMELMEAWKRKAGPRVQTVQTTRVPQPKPPPNDEQLIVLHHSHPSFPIKSHRNVHGKRSRSIPSIQGPEVRPCVLPKRR